MRGLGIEITADYHCDKNAKKTTANGGRGQLRVGKMC